MCVGCVTLGFAVGYGTLDAGDGSAMSMPYARGGPASPSAGFGASTSSYDMSGSSAFGPRTLSPLPAEYAAAVRAPLRGRVDPEASFTPVGVRHTLQVRAGLPFAGV